MKKGIILSVSIVVVLMVVAMLFTVDFTQASKSETDIIKVTVYEVGTNKKLKSIVIVSPEEIKKVTRYINKVKPLKPEETVNKALLQNVEIQYNDHITIGFQLDDPYLCTYSNTEKGICKMSHLPKELYNWAQEVTK